MQMLVTKPMQIENITEASVTQRSKAVRILAKSIFRELTAQGYNELQVVALATELIGEVANTIAARSPDDLE